MRLILAKDSVAIWPGGLLSAVILLLAGLFSLIIVRDYGWQSDAARQTLLEKGSVLIRALESGTRVGMGLRMHHAQQQTLLEEMAGQPGVLWFAVTNEQGKITTHSDPRQVGESLQEMSGLEIDAQERWRRVTVSAADGRLTPALLIWREFRPLFPSGRHRMQGRPRYGDERGQQPEKQQVIFIAFDASDLDAVRAREWRNTMMILSSLGAVLLATLLSFFWLRRYQRSRRLLQETINRKEKLVALGHLAAGMAHEIRNPLSSIKGLARYFAERAPAGGEAHQLAQVMVKEADRLNRVVSELLEWVRPVRLKLQQTDLNAVIAHSLQLVSQDARSRDIALQFTARATPCLIQADADRLTQVLLNLYLNAIQAIDHHGIITIEVSAGDGKPVRVVIKDTGQGIAPARLQEIFTPYFTTKADGTGLGLAVARNIVEQHGGAIDAESVPGDGARFIIYLPQNASQKDCHR